MRTFALIWFGQFVSLLGSGLTGFGLGVWVYQKTGSVTDFALICFATVFPGIVLAPLAGVMVDRWDRRRAMIVADTGSGVCTVAIAALLWTDGLAVWHIWLAMGVSSAFRALQAPAYAAAITLLIPKKHFTRANGAVQVAIALSYILAPVLAGGLIVAIGIEGIILIDVATFLFAVFTLLLVRIPRPEVSEEGRAAGGTLWREAAYGWRFIRSRPGLMWLMVLFAGVNFGFGSAYALFTPLVLSFASPEVLGVMASVGGLGMLAGGVLMSVWSGPRRRVAGVFAGALVLGLAMGPVGLSRNPVVMTAALFVGLLGIPVAAGCFHAIWQVKAPADVQGRVFSIRNMFVDAAVPLAFLVAGPLADHVARPLVGGGGRLAGAFRAVLGDVAGREISLAFLIIGLGLCAGTGLCLRVRGLRRLESDIPDAVGQEADGAGATALQE